LFNFGGKIGDMQPGAGGTGIHNRGCSSKVTAIKESYGGQCGGAPNATYQKRGANPRSRITLS
jgi:hypothetical protein